MCVVVTAGESSQDIVIHVVGNGWEMNGIIA